MSTRSVAVALGVAALFQALPAGAAVLEANYTFDNSLASSVAGAPDLTAVNPLGTNSFGMDTVLGQTRGVYNFTGNNVPTSNQGGLTFNNSGGQLNANSYSVEMIFKLTDRNNGWRRILDTLNRQSDSGFYVDPSNHLNVFPVSGSSISFVPDTYYDVVVTNDSGHVTVYAGGGMDFSVDTTVLNISADNVMGFFVDNVVAGGQGEWSPGSIALLSLYRGALTAAEVAALYGENTTPAPEPASLTVLGLGLAALGFARRRG